jgi:CRISPR-associated protein Cas1
LRDIDRLVCVESVQITSQAIASLMRDSIPICLLSGHGKYLGGFHPAGNHHGHSRLRQYERTKDNAFALTLARRIVNSKVYNQRRTLQRVAASRERAEGKESEAAIAISKTLAWLDSLFASIGTTTTIDELRGYEGASTARYFRCWSGFLPAEFPFERRSTRPPLNPVNACISFGSTLIYNELVSFIHAHGLDPALGLLHSTQNGRWSLALDLMEPFRPTLVEALTLDLFSHRILNSEHFEDKNSGIYLNEAGRKKFFLQYERRLERQFLSEAVGHRTTLRRQLENQVMQFKTALEDPARFEPFLIN